MNSPHLSEDAARLEMLFPRIMRILFHHTELDPLGHLSMAQLRILRLLYTDPHMTSEISAGLGMTPSAVSQTVSRLEKIGLVERLTDTSDRRIRRLVLSPEGNRLMKERQRLRVERAKGVLAAIPATHRARLIATLEELLAAAGPYLEEHESLALVAELEQSMPTIPPYVGEEASTE